MVLNKLRKTFNLHARTWNIKAYSIVYIPVYRICVCVNICMCYFDLVRLFLSSCYNPRWTITHSLSFCKFYSTLLWRLCNSGSHHFLHMQLVLHGAWQWWERVFTSEKKTEPACRLTWAFSQNALCEGNESRYRNILCTSVWSVQWESTKVTVLEGSIRLWPQLFLPQGMKEKDGSLVMLSFSNQITSSG